MHPALLNLTAALSGRTAAQPETETMAATPPLAEGSPKEGAEAEFAALFDSLGKAPTDTPTLRGAPDTPEEMTPDPEEKGRSAEARSPAPQEKEQGDVAAATQPVRKTDAPRSHVDTGEMPEEMRASALPAPAQTHSQRPQDAPDAPPKAAPAPPRGPSPADRPAHQRPSETAHAPPRPERATHMGPPEVAKTTGQSDGPVKPEMPLHATGVAHVVRAAATTPHDAIAAQQFGVSVAVAAQQMNTHRQPRPTAGLADPAPDSAARLPRLDLPDTNGHVHRAAEPQARSRAPTAHGEMAVSSPSQAVAPTKVKHAPPTQIPIMQTPDRPLAVQGDPQALLHSLSDAPVEMTWETARSHSAPILPTLSRTEMPVHVARQMAEALQRIPDKPVELTLNPEELGRVRLSISTAEAGITVNVLAERIETLDLMRRHIDQLAQEFEQMGYENIAFSFGEGAQGSDDSTPQDQAAGITAQPQDDASVTASIDINLAHAATGLDIRL